MNEAPRALFFVSVGCLVIVIVAHVASLTGIDLSTIIPNLMLLLALPVFALAAAYIVTRLVAARGGSLRARPRPLWMTVSVIALFLYVVAWLTYAATIFKGGGPEVISGHFVLWLKTQNIFVMITEAQFHHARSLVNAYITAWGIFAFFGLAALFAELGKSTKEFGRG